MLCYAMCTLHYIIYTRHWDNYSRSPSMIVIVLNAFGTQREYIVLPLQCRRSRVSYYFNVMRVIVEPVEEEAEQEKIFYVCVYRIWL